MNPIPAATSQAEAETFDILRLPKVRQRTGLARSTIYRLMACQQFPNAVQLGPRAVGWTKAAIDAWLAARPARTHCLRPVQDCIDAPTIAHTSSRTARKRSHSHVVNR
jgi:prophage regulatory protein